ncbi:MAG: riboflavin synthase [Saprospiraceae bacterium]|nr:riboflavin synthase [Saprospiraceae bacterium]
MFTGIIKDVGVVLDIERNKGIHTLSIKSKLSQKFKVDESVCHNGVCLTIISKTKTSHKVQVIPETLSKTNLGSVKKGSLINLEPSLTLQFLLSGHLVQGHVDCTSFIHEISKENNAFDVWIDIPKSYKKYLIPHGSICVNGVSLTIAELKNKRFKISLIPYTAENTNFKLFQKGDEVNLEFDVIAKYILNK